MRYGLAKSMALAAGYSAARYAGRRLVGYGINKFAGKGGAAKTRAIATKALRLAKKNRKMADRKFYDEKATITNADNSGVVNPAVQISQGTSENQRLGDDCYLKGMLVQAVLTINNAGTNPQRYRIIIVRGKQERALAPTVSDILQSSDVGAVGAVDARRNWYQTSQYQVLWDKKFKLVTMDGHYVHTIRKWIKINKKIKFVAGSNTPEDGGIYVLCISDGTVAGNTVPTYVFKYRTYFTG